MTQSFGLAPIKREGMTVVYDEFGMNPYPPPQDVYPRGESCKAAAQAYFGWELMNGADVNTLKKQPFWYHMTKGPKYAKKHGKPCGSAQSDDSGDNSNA